MSHNPIQLSAKESLRDPRALAAEQSGGEESWHREGQEATQGKAGLGWAGRGFPAVVPLEGRRGMPFPRSSRPFMAVPREASGVGTDAGRGKGLLQEGGGRREQAGSGNVWERSRRLAAPEDPSPSVWMLRFSCLFGSI